MDFIKLITPKDWPGPENPGVMSMALRHQSFIESICNESEFNRFNNEVGMLVDSWGIQDGDAWDVGAMKYWLKAWIVVMERYCRNKKVAIPGWLQYEMTIVNNGQFPVGYTTDKLEVMLVI